jgi:hypothetical protein
MHCERRATRERGRRAFAIEAITILSDADYLSRGTSVAKIKVVCLNQSKRHMHMLPARRVIGWNESVRYA